MRPLRVLLLCLPTALVAAATVAGFAATGDSQAARPVARIAPVPSPLAVPPVLERAAERLERQERLERRAQPHVRRVEEPAPEPVRRSLPQASTDAALVTADVLENGIALPPLQSPAEVRQIIEAGNAIARTPYKWGGGHGRWLDTGYDCSGSVSFALASAGLLGGPLDSGRLMSWGSPGPGRWITIWSSPTHVFLIVAGVRFDTSGTRTTGSRWQASMRSTAGFVARHPAGF